MKSLIYQILFSVCLLLSISCESKKNSKHNEKAKESNAKLLLLSNGLVNDKLKYEFINLIDSKPFSQKVAVVVNATKNEEKKIKKTKKVKVRFNEIGFDSTKIEMFDLLKRDPSELSGFDIIYILGGNPFNLLSEVKRSKADSVLKQLAFQNKILMGYSAGSLLMGPNLELMNSVDSLLGFNEIELKELKCLGIYDFLIFPHFDDFTTQAEGLTEAIDLFESQSELKIIRLNDGQGIIYNQNKIIIIGD